MSVKKLLVLSAAGIAAVGMTAAMAGGPDQMAAPIAPMFQPKVYVEGHLGYVKLDWRNFYPRTFNAFGDNSRGAFAAGGDFGYWFQKYLGVELGGFWLNEAEGTALNNGNQVNVTTWFVYGAAKLIVPIWNNFMAFGKIGAAYRQNRFSGALTGNQGSWSPVFATGLTYMFNENWNASFQYMYLPGRNKGINNNQLRNAPNASLFTAALGYMFAV